MQTSRRTFIKSVATTAAMAPYILPSRIWSAEVSPNNKITMGFIGTGKMAKGLISGFIGRPEVKIVAVADVDASRRDFAKKNVDDYYKNSDCAVYSDFRELIARKDIDAVCIATPDHLHAFITLASLKAGKDVYCEKPLTHNVHESIVIMDAVAATKRVLQTGSQQRSSKEFRVACELVQNKIVGKIKYVDCAFGGPGKPCDLPEQPVPQGLDWDSWCGPAQLRPYNAELSPLGFPNFWARWRNYKEFGGGGVSDFGAHHLDIVQWGLGMDESGPVEVIATSTPEKNKGCKLVYANGVYVEHKDNFGIRFVGEDGEVLVNRGMFKLIIKGVTHAHFESAEKTPGTSCEREIIKMEQQFLKDAPIRLYNSKNHKVDFLECIKSRKKPITNEIVGGRSAICTQLMNQSYYNKASFKWDPIKCQFAGGTGDPKWLTREYRKNWIV